MDQPNALPPAAGLNKFDAYELMRKMVLEAAKEFDVQPKKVTSRQFKAYALPKFNANEKQIAKAVERQPADDFNAWRDSVVDWSVSGRDIDREHLVTIGRQGKKEHREAAREAAAKEDFLQAMGLLLEQKSWKLPSYKPPKKVKTERVVNLLLSDLHYGADLKLEENLVRYNFVEEARRTASIFAQACSFKRDHREESILHVYLNGDLMQGMLGHDPRDGHPIAKQFYAAGWVLGQGLLYAATQYPLVKVFFQTGNHDRIKDRHFGRATNNKWDSYGMMLCFALQAQFLKAPNVQFFVDEMSWGEFDCFGRRGMYTHGDTVVPAGNPSTTLNMKEIETFVARTNAGRAAEGLPVIEALAIGHTHFSVLALLDSGCWFINNGCLIPPDGFSHSIGRIYKKHNVQALWESTPEHIVGDYRPLKVGKETDADASLDKLIVPYDGKLVLPKF